jgi:hypothetical protein
MPYLTSLAAIARSAGLTVVEQAGWQSRGHGAQTDVQAIVCHHTGGPAGGDAPSLGTVQNGRPDLAGPLSHFVLARSGVVYVVAAGQCWHAGATLQSWQSNPHSIGIEAEGTGNDTWPEVQIIAYAKLCAALAKAFGLGASRVLGHKEICAPVGRKVDPNFDMVAFRARVQKILSGVQDPDPEVPNTEENEYMSMDQGPATVGDEWGTLHVPINGNRYLRVASSYGRDVKVAMSVVDDTPATAGSWVKTVPGDLFAADRPGPIDLSKTVATYDNLSHVVVRYQCEGPVKAWTNNRA